MDIFDKCFNFTAAREAMEAGLYPYFIPLTENDGTEASFKGHRLVMCGSNNYLGLTTDPRVREAAIEAIRRYGTSCTGSRFLNGTLDLHLQLEEELADWVKKEAALVFSTGMQTNLGTISAIVGRHDIVILDKDDHASIVDGARLGWGTIKRFRHSDIGDLERVLREVPEDRGKLIAVDGLYSMGGDIAPLPEITELCQRFNARLMVDDAHALGVLGGGRGTAAHFGLTEKVDLIMSTFSKSLASLGGFIAGERTVIEYIKHNARALIFSASIPPANAAAALTALRILRAEPERVERLNRIGDYMRQELKNLGFNIGNTQSPIIPIIIGDDTLTLMATKALFERGVFVNAVLSPAVPPGQQLLRTSYMATHTDTQLNFCLEAYEKVGRELGIIGACV
jgi:8-amino-7-oxononanoate synthase